MRKIINVLCGVAFIILTGACQRVTDDRKPIGELQIIPQPVEVNMGQGFFTIGKNTVIYYKGDALLPVAGYLAAELEGPVGYDLQIREGTGDGINLSITDDRNERLGEEGYRLHVTPRNLEIEANRANGIFYGLQTVLQMLPPQVKGSTLKEDIEWKIPSAEIEDVPRFPWRGLMLDVSRHFFTKEEVKAYIDQLAEYKMNVFHWHLTDDQGWRIEIKSLPKLTEEGAWRARRVGQWWTRTPRQPGEPTEYGGFYTHADIAEIIEYAGERFVQVVPEIDVPGHSMAAIVAYPEISCTSTVKDVNVGNKFYRVDENSLCVGKERTFDYLDKIFGEVAALFPSEYIHIGGDECYKGFWSKCPDCRKRMCDEGIEDLDQLQSYFIKRVEKILESKGKKLIGWDEILEGGLAPNATVMSWRGMKGGIKAAKEGHHVIMTPTHHCYLDLYQGEPSVEPDTYSMMRLTDAYDFEPIPDGVDPALVLGGQGNLWTESVPHFRHAQYMTWPRGWALAEVLWSPKASRNWERFVDKVERHFVRADFAGIKYARSMYNTIIRPYYEDSTTFKIELHTELKDLDIYYTFDNTDPDIFSTQYEGPLSVPRDATWLRSITYRNDDPVGKMISLRIDELKQKAKR